MGMSITSEVTLFGSEHFYEYHWAVELQSVKTHCATLALLVGSGNNASCNGFCNGGKNGGLIFRYARTSFG